MGVVVVDPEKEVSVAVLLEPLENDVGLVGRRGPRWRRKHARKHRLHQGRPDGVAERRAPQRDVVGEALGEVVPGIQDLVVNDRARCRSRLQPDARPAWSPCPTVERPARWSGERTARDRSASTPPRASVQGAGDTACVNTTPSAASPSIAAVAWLPGEPTAEMASARRVSTLSKMIWRGDRGGPRLRGPRRAAAVLPERDGRRGGEQRRSREHPRVRTAVPAFRMAKNAPRLRATARMSAAPSASDAAESTESTA